MDSKSAAIILLKMFPDKKILGCYDYDSEYFLFSLSPKKFVTNNDDFYLFNKKTGGVKEYPVLKDIKKFNRIINDKTKILNFR